MSKRQPVVNDKLRLSEWQHVRDDKGHCWLIAEAVGGGYARKCQEHPPLVPIAEADTAETK